MALVVATNTVARLPPRTPVNRFWVIPAINRNQSTIVRASNTQCLPFLRQQAAIKGLVLCHDHFGGESYARILICSPPQHAPLLNIMY
jgi:hypothetical protein